MAVVGAVLAGGQSSRMGRDKALIVVEGLPLAARTANVLATAGCTNVCLVGRQHTLSGLDWPVIADHGTGYHPLAGVAAVLSRYPAGLVLVAPCDLVNLSATHITALLQHGGPCVASTGGRTHPLLAVYPGSYATMASVLATQGAPAMRLCRDLPTVELAPPALIDANHASDLPR